MVVAISGSGGRSREPLHANVSLDHKKEEELGIQYKTLKPNES